MFCLDYAFSFVLHYNAVDACNAKDLFRHDSLLWTHPKNDTEAFQWTVPNKHLNEQWTTNNQTKNNTNTTITKLILWSYGGGAISGLGTAILLYPMDVLRQSVLSKSGTSSFAFSTIPYMSLYFGTYFTLSRQQLSLFSSFETIQSDEHQEHTLITITESNDQLASTVTSTGSSTTTATSNTSFFLHQLKWATISSTVAAIGEIPFDEAKLALCSHSWKMTIFTTTLRIPLASLLLVAYDRILLSSS